MFDYSGAYGSPIRRRPMVNDAQMPDISMGEPPAQATPGFLDGMTGPERPSYGDSFLAGMQQNRNNGTNRIMAGLSGWAGAGGIRGGIGTAARFLI